VVSAPRIAGVISESMRNHRAVARALRTGNNCSRHRPLSGIGASQTSLTCLRSLRRDFRDYPNDPDDYELLEELGKGASATVSDQQSLDLLVVVIQTLQALC